MRVVEARARLTMECCVAAPEQRPVQVSHQTGRPGSGQVSIVRYELEP